MSDKHEWLNLIEVSGPFLAVPVLREVFPQGLEELDSSRAKRLRSAYEEWRDAVDGDDTDRDELHAAWIDEVLRGALEADDQLLRLGEAVPASVARLPEHDTTIVPELVFVDPTHDDVVLAPAHVFPPDTDLSASMKFGGLSCSPGDRMALHLHALNVPVGILTNGERWMLVHAPAGKVATFASWDARIWGQEPATLRAFASLLGVRRFFAQEQDRLPGLFERSLKHQDEVTDALGDQVRRAIEVLVQALDRADQDRNRELLRDVKPQELYEAGLTVMMRLVFLLAAEERGLLLLGEPRYDSFYAVSTLRMQLRAESDEILERRRAAWSRLLAVFRAVFGGIDHPTLRMPAMGGSLFDPDRFPFLEGRLKGTSWRQHCAEPLPIDDRTVLLLLDAIQTFEGRTLSYRGLDVEQIGHVYEGLLERTVSRVDDVTLELEAGAQAKDARVTLGELESARLDGKASVTNLLVNRSKRSQSAIQKELGAEVEPQQSARLLSACRGDVNLRDRLEPYVRLLRTDPWGYPLVHPKEAFVVVLGADRRETGTHYTPKSLTERIVEETLTPLVYDGPAQGTPRAEWKLKTPEQLLDVKVCDPAMGSGAFLVQACRFLSVRLVEAWSRAEAAGRILDVTGRTHESRIRVDPMPSDNTMRAEYARRIVASRCLYGVDANPLAVELAKLSLWLVTLSKGLPFGFLEHSLRCGDSLLGIKNLSEITDVLVASAKESLGHQFEDLLHRSLSRAVALRVSIRDMPIRDVCDIEVLATLDGAVRADLAPFAFIANDFMKVVFTTKSAPLQRSHLAGLTAEAERLIRLGSNAPQDLDGLGSAAVAATSTEVCPDRAFHWQLAFPEVFQRDRSGFDAFIGNPPFLGGKRITTVLGRAYNAFLAAAHPGATKNTDLVAHFFRRSFALLREGGTMGFVAVKTIAEGKTREGGLEWMIQNGAVIHAAHPNETWPGTASVVTSRVHVHRGPWSGRRYLSGKSVPLISSLLSDQGAIGLAQLTANASRAFIGSYVNGKGFVLSSEEARTLIAADPRNAEVVFPYLTGKEMNSDPAQRPRRWVINFWDWPDEKAASFPEPFEWLKAHVYQERLEKSDQESYRNIMSSWWQHWNARPGLYHALGYGSRFMRDWSESAGARRPLARALAVARNSSTLAFAFIDPSHVFSEQVVIFAFEDAAHFAALQSSIHAAFVWNRPSKLGHGLRYTPTVAFEPFPLPREAALANPVLTNVGESYHSRRARYMISGRLGLTELYKRIHDPAESDGCIDELRDLHIRTDRAVAAAYGWTDLDLGHGFHEQSYLPQADRQRFTISDFARAEVLQRLSELNHRREQEEAASGVTCSLERLARTRAAEQDHQALDSKAPELGAARASSKHRRRSGRDSK